MLRRISLLSVRDCVVDGPFSTLYGGPNSGPLGKVERVEEGIRPVRRQDLRIVRRRC